MADARKADSVVWVRRRNGASTKIELFFAKQFPVEDFDNTQGERILQHQRGRYLRVRIDGVWFPNGFKRLFTKTQCHELIKEAVFDEVD